MNWLHVNENRSPNQHVNGLIDCNKVWYENEWQKQYLFLGEGNISWYVYDLNTKRYCELDNPSGGFWREENRLPYNIIVGGEPLTYMGEDAEEIMTWKSDEEVVEIAEYLKWHDLSEIIRNNHSRIDEEYYYRAVDDEDLEYLLGWCGNIRTFYENAAQEGYHVIFSVDV